jgi:hypothetical protein
MYRPFILQFQTLIENLGYKTITEFVNKWISDGETFKSIHEWLLLKGFEFEYITIYNNLRKFLTIPYDTIDEYFYRWNGIAKAKGYKSVKQMISSLLGKYTTKEILIELDVDRGTLRDLKFRLKEQETNPRKPSNKKKQRTRDGFSRGSTSEKWRGIWESKGFRGFRDAIQKMRLKGMSYKDISKEFGVTPRDLRIRLKAAKLDSKDFPNQRKLFRKILKFQPHP